MSMEGWAKRSGRDFVRETKDGHRLNIYWACGGYWLIKAGRVHRDEDWAFFVGRHGRRMRGSSRGWVNLATAEKWADVFSWDHDGWVGTTTYEAA